MRTDNPIYIKRIKNLNHWALEFALQEIEPYTIPKHESIDTNIALPEPGSNLLFVVKADETGEVLHCIELKYEVVDSLNQFSYRLEGSDTYTPADSPTSGRDIFLALNCDGTVVVGTGDWGK